MTEREWEDRYAAFAERTGAKYAALHDLLEELLAAYEHSDVIGHVSDRELIDRIRAHLGHPPIPTPVLKFQFVTDPG